MYFKIPELGNVSVTARRKLRPVLVLTSNTERDLAEAFLRRCVFYHIPFPDDKRLRQIVHSRLAEAIAGDSGVLEAATEIFQRLRDPSAGLSKQPSTGEFLAWLRIIKPGSDGRPLELADATMIEPTLCSLIKTVDDRPKARELLLEWLESKRE